ncbi:WLM domain-containing protein [Phialemonium atrogriseum]|uniref:WLM domain-containing protein n=1 Tax=Phialemonium atrogriseum TaxID=1093897 RepID=A0AAJ0CAP7_9PEZI|nr:WLM domain-containing protein [Phialemonium atrogriseum]KAK1772652.1 WLM domain-containing protein [Phialemonium atrogriseum]
MRKHQFSVGLLTEMDPAAHTSSSHEGTSRTLGLNRNRGEVVELRLRTDAYDGYRDYRTIRRTLCHELAHNVHGPHDRAFWDLCHQIEREVDAADWTSGGHTVGQDEFAPERGVEEDEVMDHGGWAGGEFVLGGGGGSSSSGSGGGRSNGGAEPLSRREILARAAEERIRNLEKANRSDEGGGSGETHEGSQS